MTSDLLKADDMATLLGLSRRKVSDLAARGLLTRTSRGQYELASIRLYVSHLRTIAAARGGDDDIDLTAERARLARAQADKAEAQVRVLRGELVEVDAVKREWSDILRSVRSRVLSVPSRVRQSLPHLTGHDVERLDSELRRSLEEASRDE